MRRALSSVIACGVSVLLSVSAADSSRALSDRKLPTGYVLGPGDQISIWALECEEISQKPYRIDETGVLNLPMTGPVRASGVTITQLEQALKTKLAKFIKEPQVTVSVTEFGSQPVSVMGAVNKAGVVTLQGRRTLMEALSAAGGLRSDAGSKIYITRRTDAGDLPLTDAKTDANFATGEVEVGALIEAKNPALNIEVRPNDVITVPVSGTVYVMGEVTKQGGFPLGNQDSITVMQAISLAGGLGRVASPKHARILRYTRGSKDRSEVAVDVKTILGGKAPDVALHADDILVVPFNKPKAVALRSIDAAVSAGTGIVIWRSSR